MVYSSFLKVVLNAGGNKLFTSVPTLLPQKRADLDILEQKTAGRAPGSTGVRW